MPTKTKPSISLHNKKVSLNFIDVDLVITKPDFANDNIFSPDDLKIDFVTIVGTSIPDSAQTDND